MKKPIISLAAIERVDAVPLRTALDRHRKATSEIAAARIREAALKNEIEGFLATCSPDDEKSLQMISGKKIQAEILPNLIKKVEGVLADELAPALLVAADQFQSELKRFYTGTHEALAVQISAMFKPYFADRPDARNGVADRARAIACQTDDCLAAEHRLAEAEAVILPHDRVRSNSPERYDQSLIGAAESLLALAERS